MPTTQQPTVVADRYVLQTRIGADATSVRWLANDIVLDRRVVLELIRPEVGDDPDAMEAIDAAARALARVNGSVLLGLLDAGVHDGSRFFVTEYASGQTYEEVLREQGPIASDEAVAVGRQVLRGMADAHAAGVADLDVRQGTVVRTADGLRLRAPGAAHIVARVRGTASAGRSPRSAEVIEERIDQPDERTDVRAVGELLFELLSGRPPSPAARFVRAERRDVSSALDAVIARALAPDPLDRYPDVPSMLSALGRVDHGTGPAPPSDEPPTTGRPAARPWHGVFRTWLAVPLVVVVGAVAVVAIGLRLGRFELGGPVGIRIHEESPPAESPAGPATIPVVSVAAHDPDGDGHENDDSAELAADGDQATVWRSENYYDGQLYKEGVGLLLDLGQTRDVGGVRLWTPAPGFTFSVRLGDDPDALVDLEAPETQAGAETRVQIDRGRGRYLLIWATSVVATGDGNRVEISEVRVLEASA